MEQSALDKVRTNGSNSGMSEKTLIGIAIDLAGGDRKLAAQFGLTYQAVANWGRRGRLPRTEFLPRAAGGTRYATAIARMTGGKVKAAQLRACGRPGN